MLLVVCQLSRDVIGCEDCKRDVTSNSPSQDYTHPDDHNLPNYDMTPGFKPFTVLSSESRRNEFGYLSRLLFFSLLVDRLSVLG